MREIWRGASHQFQWTLSQFPWMGDADKARYSKLWQEGEASVQARLRRAVVTH